MIRLTFKTPDAVTDAVDRAIQTGELAEEDREKAITACEKWSEYGEYLYVDIDIKEDTCRVVKAG